MAVSGGPAGLSGSPLSVTSSAGQGMNHKLGSSIEAEDIKEALEKFGTIPKSSRIGAYLGECDVISCRTSFSRFQ